MSTVGGELQAMADFVAQAIHRQAVGDDDEAEEWIDLTEEERNEFRLVAHAAMGAHDAWLATAGYVIARVERTPKGRKKLIVPSKPGLIRGH